MPARVTLATTTLSTPVNASDGRILPASTSGLFPQTRLWMDRELMRVIAVEPTGWVQVHRGVDGSASAPHASGITITIGRADQFYSYDPVGRPPEAIEVDPWINVLNGNVWRAQGDTDPVGLADRWWQLQTTTYDVGALGVRTKSISPDSST